MKKLNAMKDFRVKEDPQEAWNKFRVAIFRGTEDVLSGAPSLQPQFMDDAGQEMSR